MLLDRETLDLLPRAARGHRRRRRRPLQARAAGRAARARACRRRARCPPRSRRWRRRRRDLAAAAEPVGRLAAAGVAPVRRRRSASSTAASATTLTAAEYGDDRAPPARLRAPGARRGRRRGRARSPSTTACARGCPMLAALAANAPFHGGRDTGLASIRPKIARAAAAPGHPAGDRARGRRSPRRCAWGAASGAVPEPRRWWWELRPHPALRHARGARARRPGDGRGRRRGRRGGPRARRAGCAERHDAGEPLADGRHVAAGGEPLVGRALGHGCRAGRPARRARARPRASCLAALVDRARARRRAARLRGASSRDARGWRPTTARSASARRGRAPARCARWPPGSPTRYAPSRRLRAGARRVTGVTMTCRLPAPRGATSAAAAGRARAAPRTTSPPIALPAGADPLADEDLQLALYCCYELHYRGFAGVDDRWEWEPSLLALRARARGSGSRPRCASCVGAVGRAPGPERDGPRAARDR